MKSKNNLLKPLKNVGIKYRYNHSVEAEVFRIKSSKIDVGLARSGLTLTTFEVVMWSISIRLGLSYSLSEWLL